MEPQKKHLMIVAGEASGDMHAARLVEELKSLDPQLTFSGVGGFKMRTAGVDLYADITSLAVIGFAEVLKNFSQLKKIFNLILARVDATRPDAVILVDYPGFNLRLARELKKRNVKVIYYISPQVWAWKENRVELVRQYVDKMLVLFKFEKEFYAKRGLEVEFVGHPLLDANGVKVGRDTFFRSIDFALNHLTIGLLPGSRKKEVSVHLPIMLKAVSILRQKNEKIQCLLIRASTVPIKILKEHLRSVNFPVRIIDDAGLVGIHASDVCLVASGTATLETAIAQKPMVVIYKTSLLTWALAKLFVKIPCIGLVNVVAGKRIVPECVQFDATPQKIAQTLEGLLADPAKINQIKEALALVKSSLGEPGASRRAAEVILKNI